MTVKREKRSVGRSVERTNERSEREARTGSDKEVSGGLADERARKRERERERAKG